MRPVSTHRATLCSAMNRSGFSTASPSSASIPTATIGRVSPAGPQPQHGDQREQETGAQPQLAVSTSSRSTVKP